MKCKDCKNLAKLSNTDESRQGICTYPMSYTPVSVDNNCIFEPQPYKCKDCDHFYNDTACMTAEENDLAYKDGELCCGFTDIKEAELYNTLADWKLRGYNIEEKLKSILDDFNKNFKTPWC